MGDNVVIDLVYYSYETGMMGIRVNREGKGGMVLNFPVGFLQSYLKTLNSIPEYFRWGASVAN